MKQLTLLGTAGAVADGQRDNVSLLFSAQQGSLPDFHLLIECGGSAAHKLARLGVAYEGLEHIVITHTHLDHLYGLPGFLFSIKYRNQSRTAPLRIYCPEEASEFIASLLDIFGVREKSPYPIELHGVPPEENAPVFENERITVTSTPVDHVPDMPTIGVKIVSKLSGKTMVYSSDTGYSERVIRFAKGADMLFHECCGLSRPDIPPFHSSALHVGQVAKKAGVKKLVLVHLDTVLNDAPDKLVAEVQQNFQGETVVASDFQTFELETNEGWTKNL